VNFSLDCEYIYVFYLFIFLYEVSCINAMSSEDERADILDDDGEDKTVRSANSLDARGTYSIS
jgi:hypothetical protein